jgi:hypothetical protein
VLNNKLLRIVQNRHIKTRVANLYKPFNTLPASALHHYQLLLFVHKCLYCNHMMPNIFNGYFARNSSLYTRITRSYHKLHMYSVRSTYGLGCSRFKASQLWNNLPTKLTNISSNYIFKRELKYHMLQIWNVDTVINVTLSSCRMSVIVFLSVRVVFYRRIKFFLFFLVSLSRCADPYITYNKMLYFVIVCLLSEIKLCGRNFDAPLF